MSHADGGRSHEPITRDSVYEQVWATPFAQVAKALAVSERALAHACTQ